MPDSDNREQLREKYYQQSVKQQQDRLKKIFADPGDINDFYLYFDDYKIDTLGKVRTGVESGDKQAMLALLVVTADALDAFEVLSKDVRKALADSLQKMRISLEDDSGFIPRGSGNKTNSEKQKQSNKKYSIALKVELFRTHKKISLEEAIAEVSEETGLTDSAVQKYWQKKHKDAKNTLTLFKSFKQPAQTTKSRPKKKKKP